MSDSPGNPRVEPAGSDDQSRRDYGRQLAMDALLQSVLERGTAVERHAPVKSLWRRSHAGLALAACALLCLGIVGVVVNRSARPVREVIQPDAAVVLAADWRIRPGPSASYRVLGSHAVQLDRGDLFVESVPTSGNAARTAFSITTSSGTVSTSETHCYVGTLQSAVKPSGESMNSSTRVFVLAGMVTLANHFGTVTGRTNEVLAADTGRAPVEVMKLAPPKQARPPGSTLFQMFVREKGDIASAWEFDPSVADEPVVQRCVFRKSYWEAEPTSDRLIRLQWPGERGGYSVDLYHINYADWSLRPIFTGEQAFAIGTTPERTYLRTSDGPRVVDLKTGQLTPSSFHSVLHQGKTGWIVELDRKDKPTYGLFNPKTGVVERELKDFPPGIDEAVNDRYTFDNDERYCIVKGDYAKDEDLKFGVSSIIEQTLILYDMKEGTRTNFTSRISAEGGSGIRVLTAGSVVNFNGQTFQYTTIPANSKDPTRLEWVTVDLKTAKEVSREAVDELTMMRIRDPQRLDMTLPKHLEKYFKQGGTEGSWQDRVALGLVRTHSLVLEDQEAGKLEVPNGSMFNFVTLSPDAQKLLAMRGGKLYYFDLQQKTSRVVQVPDKLKDAYPITPRVVQIP